MLTALGRIASAWILAIASAGAQMAWASPVQGPGPEISRLAARDIEFETDVATWSNLDVGRDGQILFELLGNIYRLPAEGGKAYLLPSGQGWSSLPKFSPDGRQIAFLSDLDGGKRNVWTMNADGSGLRRISDSNRDVISIAWQRDGKSILALRYFAPTLEGGLFVQYGLDGSVKPINEHVGTETAGTRYSYIAEFDVDADGVVYLTFVRKFEAGFSRRKSQVIAIDPSNGRTIVLPAGSGDSFAPRVSPDGKQLVYLHREGGRTALRIRSLANGSERTIATDILRDLKREIIEAFDRGSVPAYAFSPDGRSIIFSVDGKIRRFSLESGKDELVPFVARASVKTIRPRQFKNDVSEAALARKLGRVELLSSQRGLLFAAGGKLRTADLKTGRVVRVTTGKEREAHPTASPDGRKIAFLELANSGTSLAVVDRNGRNKKVIGSGQVLIGPSWSPDGRQLAYYEVQEEPCNGVASPPECKLFGKVVRISMRVADLKSGSSRTVVDAMLTAGWNPRDLGVLSYGQSSNELFYHQVGLVTANSPAERSNVSAMDLNTGKVRSLIEFSPTVTQFIEQATPSPDGRRIALRFSDSVYLLEFSGQESRRYSSLEEVEKASTWLGPSTDSTSWRRDGWLIWAFGNEVYSWKPGLKQPVMMGSVTLNLGAPLERSLLAFKNARIITMDGDKVFEEGTLLIEGGKIKSVGPDELEIPAGAKVVDGRGLTIIPGLVDTHGHAHLRSERQWGRPPLQSGSALRFLSFGVTTLYDPQADPFEESELIAAGEMIGPRIYSSGDAIFGERSNNPTWAKSLDDLDYIVRNRIASGAIMLKSYMIDRRDWRREIVSAAAAGRAMVTTEGGNLYYHMLTHIADGHAAIEHNFPNIIHADVVRYIAESGVFYTPVLVQSTCLPFGRTVFTARSPYRSIFTRFSSLSSSTRYKSDSYTPDSEQCVYGAAATAKDVVRAGGRVTMGSHGEDPGLSAHWEMWLLSSGGLTPTEVLRVATISGAEKLGLTRNIGSLEAGKFADFVILNCNPLENIRCTADIKYVAKSGVLYDATSITELFPKYRGLPDSFWKMNPKLERIAPANPLPIAAARH